MNGDIVSIGFFKWALGGAISVAVFAFGWIIKLLKSQAADKEQLVASQTESDKQVLTNAKDIESLKEKSEGVQKKIEDLTLEVTQMKITTEENGIINRSLSKDFGKLESKFDSMDNKLDSIILSVAKISNS